MISLDQIHLLEKKVEGAVAKIAQLQAENDALRKSCAELTNALSAKSEQLSAFEQDQGKIEDGIIKALDRLNSIENSILNAAGRALSGQEQKTAPASQPDGQVQPARQMPVSQEEEPASQNSVRQEITETPAEPSVQPENLQNQTQFFDMENVSQNDEAAVSDEEYDSPDNGQQTSDSSENGMFDIF